MMSCASSVKSNCGYLELSLICDNRIALYLRLNDLFVKLILFQQI